MEEDNQSTGPDTTNGGVAASSSSLCGECNKEKSKYKCPGCTIRTCSLPCVKAHKQRTSCSGKRDVAQFVPLSQFDDKTLLSDYNMLEEVKRVTDSAQRMSNKLRVYPQFKLPIHLECLCNAAARQRTQILYLPSGMCRREKNQSHFNWRKKLISWTVEWRFHSTDVVLLDHEVLEDLNLCSVIERHLQPSPWKNKVWPFYEEKLESLKFFIRKCPKGAKSPFKELDIKVPIKQLLANIIILEYPVIHVFLPSHSCDFEIVKDPPPVPRRMELKDSVIDDPKSPKGVTFREEEIEEDVGSPKPRILDLMSSEISSPTRQIPNRNRGEKALNKPVDMTVLATEATDNSSHMSSNTMETGLFDDLDFKFDQGLIDAYSDLNPDEFLDFDGEFIEEAEVKEKSYLSHSRGGPLPNEELEEGEIAE